MTNIKMRGRRVRIGVLFFVPIVVGALGGCAAEPKSGPTLLIWPPPPAEPRVQFLTWASGADEVERSHGAFEQFILGEEPSVKRAINKPYGVAVRDGVAYVCDTKGLALCRLDFKNHRYDVLGTSGPGRLRKPINVVIDALGYKFVADPVRKQVVVFGPEDTYATAFNIPEPCNPVDLAVHGNELFVLDNDDSCQIVVLDRQSGEVIRTFGGPGGEPGQFHKPNSLAVSPDGFLYVSDTHNWRIQKLTLDGKPVWVKGTPGYELGRFGRPRGIRVGPDGIVYVVDGATEIVQMLDGDGKVLMRFGGPGNMPGALGLPSTLAIDRDSLSYFAEYIHPDFKVDYLLFVVSQYGGHLLNVYAFGSFPEGYSFSNLQIAPLPAAEPGTGIGPAEGPEPTSPPSSPQEEPAVPDERD